jgi:4-hydroxythreonine-4-phosphate dehydrogenase
MAVGIPIAVTMGEPAGVGGELTLAAWLQRERHNLPQFFAIDEPNRLANLASRLNWPVPIKVVEVPELVGSVFAEALPVLPQSLTASVSYRNPNPCNSPAVLDSIRKAVTLALAGRVSAVVTNPIQKSTLHSCGFAYPGHTEFITSLTGRKEGTAVMMLASPRGLRVVPVTIHVPFSAVPNMLSTSLIQYNAIVTLTALRRDFGLSRPRLAVAGLNPHAGENGVIGREEIEIIKPAVLELQKQGLPVTGPYPADTLFHIRAQKQYDAVLCMYHDQGLIPLKAMDFERGVNMTLGLPLVRTSPDHGTALDIAGCGLANPESFVTALTMAAKISRQRAEYTDELNLKDTLKICSTL